MVIEWLTFEMAPENRPAFIEQDTEIWTAALSRYPGYLSKEVWIAPEADNRVTMVIRWASREQWKAIPEAVLTQVTEQFDQAVGFNYSMVESKEYQVRRFPSGN